MYKLITFAVCVTAGGLLPVVVNGDEQLWLNELWYEGPTDTSTGYVARFEVVMRPEAEDAEKKVTTFKMEWYAAGEKAVDESTWPIGSTEDLPTEADPLWKGNWYGTGDASATGLKDVFDPSKIGGVKLSSGLSSLTRYYCWGNNAKVDEPLLTGDTTTNCQRVVSTSFVAELDNFALMDKSSPVEGGGSKEDDFEYRRNVDSSSVVFRSLGHPNNCVSSLSSQDVTCEASIVQTFAEYSLAWSVKSAFVIVGAAIASMLPLVAD